MEFYDILTQEPKIYKETFTADQITQDFYKNHGDISNHKPKITKMKVKSKSQNQLQLNNNNQDITKLNSQQQQFTISNIESYNQEPEQQIIAEIIVQSDLLPQIETSIEIPDICIIHDVIYLIDYQQQIINRSRFDLMTSEQFNKSFYVAVNQLIDEQSITYSKRSTLTKTKFQLSQLIKVCGKYNISEIEGHFIYSVESNLSKYTKQQIQDAILYPEIKRCQHIQLEKDMHEIAIYSYLILVKECQQIMGFNELKQCEIENWHLKNFHNRVSILFTRQIK
ncbi:Hypothetical_protein [Hexamita inflata]|uniref:Hypothetical_protein n=1 Tax=Hexamita inflata TaxID=28002 RepID=A0AA86N680_9EUKA|nr:Hypothetical protein HINF_LOCUS1240 [Hexamita inflata]